MSVSGGRGVVVGDYATVLQMFAGAPSSLSTLMRVGEFRALIDEATARFVGRDVVLRAIEDILKDPESLSGYIVVQGEPGIGKTTVLAQLVKTHGCVHHFNSAPRGVTSPAAFLSNVCAQLIVRYGLPYEILPAEATMDGGFLVRLLDEVASDPANCPVLLAVDALDEAEKTRPGAGNNRLFLPPALPAGVFLVVSTRDEEDSQLYITARHDLYLREGDPGNIADIRAYIVNYVADSGSRMQAAVSDWTGSVEAFVDLVTARSEGNFMYLVNVLRDIRDGTLTPGGLDGVEHLPSGLRGYYRRHWDDMRGADKDRFSRYEEPIICLLATAREPVQIEDVLGWMREFWRSRSWDPLQVDRRAVLDVIDRWREFLNVDGTGPARRYRLYHVSFQDFLREEVGLTTYHETIDNAALAKIPGFLPDP